MDRQAPSPTAPAGVRALLILLLPLIALALYLDGQRYADDLLRFEPGAAAPETLPARLAGMDRSGPLRRYGKDNLYEYINGHAEYFIGAGFAGLSVGDYGAGADGAPRLVINLYDMAGALNAFGVLVNEAGSQKSVDVGALGFRAGKGVSFIHGPYYVQASAYDAGLDVEAAARELAAALAQQVPEKDLAFRFPDFGKAAGTRYVREYYRGMEFLNQVVERTFERGERSFQAFVISGPEARIQATVGAMTRFLEDDGIPFSAREVNGLVFTRVQDPYEGDWFFVPLAGRLLGAYVALDPDIEQAVSRFAAAQP